MKKLLALLLVLAMIFSFTAVFTACKEEVVYQDDDETQDPSDPSDPSNPTDPPDPSDPSDPADPTDPTDPSDPTDPTNPSDPTEPDEPEVPEGAVTGTVNVPASDGEHLNIRTGPGTNYEIAGYLYTGDRVISPRG